MKRRLTAGCAIASAVMWTGGATAQQFFQVLPALSGVGADSGLFLSSDGRAVYGFSAGTRTIWRDGQPVAFTAPGSGATVVGIADVGNVIAGTVQQSSNPTTYRAYRWTPSGTTYFNGYSSFAQSLSPDGVAIIGQESFFNPESLPRPFNWGGPYPGMLPIGSASITLTHVSNGGRVLTGTMVGPPGHTAFIYDIPANNLRWVLFSPRLISPDGAVVFNQVGRWLSPDLVYPLNFPVAGASRSAWRAVGNSGGPMVWDAVRGERSVSMMLDEAGLGTQGVTLTSVFGVSEDGAVFAGNGSQPGIGSVIWLARTEAFCYANCDGSSTAPMLNVLDFNCFLNRFAAGLSGDPLSLVYANCDNSSTVPALSAADFACFISAFTAGCP
jgi:hypothetical protein